MTLHGQKIKKMAKANVPETNPNDDHIPERQSPSLDSKYRMIIVAAQRSKQLQRGARPRVELDSQPHKHTRIALAEAEQGKIEFTYTDQE